MKRAASMVGILLFLLLAWGFVEARLILDVPLRFRCTPELTMITLYENIDPQPDAT